MSIGIWCRQKLNFKYFIQSLKILQIKLTKTSFTQPSYDRLWLAVSTLYMNSVQFFPYSQTITSNRCKIGCGIFVNAGLD